MHRVKPIESIDRMHRVSTSENIVYNSSVKNFLRNAFIVFSTSCYNASANVELRKLSIASGSVCLCVVLSKLGWKLLVRNTISYSI